MIDLSFVQLKDHKHPKDVQKIHADFFILYKNWMEMLKKKYIFLSQKKGHARLEVESLLC